MNVNKFFVLLVLAVLVFSGKYFGKAINKIFRLLETIFILFVLFLMISYVINGITHGYG